jgi:hypothetical protein
MYSVEFAIRQFLFTTGYWETAVGSLNTLAGLWGLVTQLVTVQFSNSTNLRGVAEM